MEDAVPLRLEEPVALVQVVQEGVTRLGQALRARVELVPGAGDSLDDPGQLNTDPVHLGLHLDAHVAHDPVGHGLRALDDLERAGRPLVPEPADGLLEISGAGSHRAQSFGDPGRLLSGAGHSLTQGVQPAAEQGRRTGQGSVEAVDALAQAREPLLVGLEALRRGSQELRTQVVAAGRHPDAQGLQRLLGLGPLTFGEGGQGLQSVQRLTGAGCALTDLRTDLRQPARHRRLQLRDPALEGGLERQDSAAERRGQLVEPSGQLAAQFTELAAGPLVQAPQLGGPLDAVDREGAGGPVELLAERVEPGGEAVLHRVEPARDLLALCLH